LKNNFKYFLGEMMKLLTIITALIFSVSSFAIPTELQNTTWEMNQKDTYVKLTIHNTQSTLEFGGLMIGSYGELSFEVDDLVLVDNDSTDQLTMGKPKIAIIMNNDVINHIYQVNDNCLLFEDSLYSEDPLTECLRR
jgi:hypothetical protein